MKPIGFLFITAMLAAVIIGCSNGYDGSGNSPLTPKGNANEVRDIGESSGCPDLWGLWNIEINTATGRVETVPLRGASFTANVNNLLEAKPGNLLIQDMDISDFASEGRLDCTIRLTHPFTGLSQYNGFDVWGVFMHNGASALNYGGLTYPGGPVAGDDEAMLLNADGYTRWYNQAEFDGNGSPLLEFWPGKLANLANSTAMLNGYKIFADGLGTEDDYYSWITVPDNSANRGWFTAGTANSRRYELEFPMASGTPTVTFQYAVVASWEPGDPTLTGNPSEYDPMDFPSSANCAEAFFIHAPTDGSTLFYTSSGASGGSLVSDIEVFDWQGGAVGGNGVLNEINRMFIEGEFLPSGFAEFSQADLVAIASPGTENSSVFQVDIAGCDPLASGPTDFWVIVEAAGDNSETYGQGFPTQYPDVRRAAFLRGIVEVSSEALEFTVTAVDPNTAPFWSYVDNAHITGSNFQDGATVQLRKSGQPSVDGANVVWIDSGSIDCDFDLKGVKSGEWDVVIINPDLQEAALAAGFTIDEWSEETEVATSGCKLPRLAETSTGDMVLVTGNNDFTVKYQTYDALGAGWAGPYVAINQAPHDFLISVWADPVNDGVYMFNTPGSQLVYRYTGGSGLWETMPDPVSGCRCAAVTADNNGRIQLFDNTSSAFGFVIQIRAPYWGYTGGWDIVYFMDSYNDKTLSQGNILTQDSSGTIFCAYEKDRALDPYSPGSGPRGVRVGYAPLGQYVMFNFHVIEENYDQRLDSPGITCTPDDYVHAIYRHFADAANQWRMEYKRSTDGGDSWGDNSIVWSGTDEPEKGYDYLWSDSGGNLHALYNIVGDIQYKGSADGATWSSSEAVNESDPDPGDSDFKPHSVVTSDDILHVVWVRGNAATGYGAIVHRMRDLP